MRLYNIELKNFRNYIKKDFQFSTNCAIIEGKNGSGKSTIKEAILYGLYGRDLQGSTRLLDNLITTGEKQATVACDFGDFKITRVKNQSKAIIMLDDKSQDIKDAIVPQRDIDSMLPDAELFQSIFDVGYFMTLPENDQRRLFIDNTPKINRKDLWHEKYKDALTEKYDILFGDYDQERMRYKRMADSAERELVVLRTKITETHISPEEVTRAEKKEKELREKIRATKETTCEKCGQRVESKESIDLRRDYIIAQHEMVSLQSKQREQLESSDAEKNKIEELEQTIIDCREIYKRLSPSGMPAVEAGMKLEPIIKYLSKQIPGLRIETLARVKTTIDWKECFEVFVGQVPYKRLSTGEKIKVDLAFSEMLNILTDRAVDMYFVDNYESVTGELPKVDGQLFLSRVVENKELTVTEKGGK